MDWFMSMTGKGKRKEKESPTPVAEESRPYLEEPYVKDKLIDCNLHKLVALPCDVDRDEWLATHTISFFEHINLMYGSISEYCTSTGCSSMVGPCNTQYLWFDEKGKKCKCAAPQYVDYVMTFTQKTVQDEAVFPTKYGNPYPSSFGSIVKKIHRYFFHVLAHIYHCHYAQIQLLRLTPHLNSVFHHYTTFNRTFKLVDEKETDILDELFVKLDGLSLHCVDIPVDDGLPAPPQGSKDEVDKMSISTANTEDKENDSVSMNSDLPLPPPPQEMTSS